MVIGHTNVVLCMATMNMLLPVLDQGISQFRDRMWCNVAWLDATQTDVGHFHSPKETQGPLHQHMV